MKRILHTHHIIPKHCGGTDDPSNLIELTIEEHAEAHRLLYEEHGHWQDKVAWQGLAGLISHEQIMREMYDARIGKPGKPHTEESKAALRKALKGNGKGIPKSVEHRRKISKATSGKNNPMYGKTPWNKGKTTGPQSAETRRKKGKPLIYNGIEYNSINEAEKLTGVSAYYIGKSCEFI